MKYLARYTHRVAISNQRLEKLEEGRVTFRYKDYADKQRSRSMTLTAEEFLRRFMQHVLPKGFVKIRHYGLLANNRREQLLALCRQLLLPLLVLSQPLAAETKAEHATIEPTLERQCPHCGGRRLIIRALPAEERLRRPVDTS